MRTNTVTEALETSMDHEQQIARRRKSAVRTAWLIAAVAVIIFVLFILSGVWGR